MDADKLAAATAVSPAARARPRSPQRSEYPRATLYRHVDFAAARGRS
jgi:hypothetical protein